MNAASDRSRASEEYSYTAKLTRRDWAWEFLRRNPKFRAQSAPLARRMNEFNTAVEIVDTADFSKEWGCLFAASPDTSALKAAVFWAPELCPDVLPMVAFERRAGLGTAVFDLAKMQCRTVMIKRRDERQHVLFQNGSRTFQIAVTGADLSTLVHLLPEPIPPAYDREIYLRGLQQISMLQATGCLPTDLADGLPSLRLRLVLQALDGFLAGKPHREIAVALFGAKRVAEDWNNPGRYLQDQVRRAVRRGRSLMEGGYLHLLAGNPIGREILQNRRPGAVSR